MEARNNNTLEMVAIHEAGHAVIVHWLEATINRVTVNSDEDYLGVVLRELIPGDDPYDSDIDDEIDVRNVILICVGGIAAELIQRNYYDEVGAGEDLLKADLYAGYIASGPQHGVDIVDECVEKAKAVLQERWSAVQALTMALLERKELTGAESVQIIESALG